MFSKSAYDFEEGLSRNLKRRLFIFLLAILFASPAIMSAQSTTTLTISKTHNATTPIASGMQFTYTITYGWSSTGSSGPGTIYIVDNVPSNLDVISAAPGSPVSVITGNQVVFTINNATNPSGSGIVQITARFKPGITCAGAQACNRAGITLDPNSGVFVYSNQSCVTAGTPANNWQFEKELVAGCALDDEVIFRIKIINPWNNDIGGLNLNNININDIVPSGAVVTGVTGWWNGISGTLLTGGPSTLNVSSMYQWYVAYVKVQFPSGNFTAGQTVVNTAQMQFNTPCDPKTVTWTDTAKVTLCTGISKGSLGKWLSLSMYFPNNPSWYPTFSPGCCGTYQLSYTNNGTLAQPNFVMEDILPTTVDLNVIRTSVPPNDTVRVDIYCWSGSSCSTSPCSTIVYNNPSNFAQFQTINVTQSNVCRVKWSYNKPVAISQYLYNNLDVCVRTTDFATGNNVVVGQNITNTLNASASNLPLQTVTHTKVVDATAPKVIPTKLFVGDCTPGCNVAPGGPYQPGDTVRFRIAVTNIGSANAINCVINDVLPAGITYIGNETYYYGAFNWQASIYNPPCCSLNVTVPSQIGGTITTPTVGQTNLTWTFPVLPYRCDGQVEYFFIDFDVKISSNPPAAPGQYKNNYTFTATGVPAVLSNDAWFTVSQTAQVQAIKEVRKAGSGNPWGFSASGPAGSNVEFKVSVINTGNSQLTGLCLLDIMPHITDVNVLPPYNPRNSAFDLPYLPANGPITITPAGFTSYYAGSGFIQSKNPTRTTECFGFCGVTSNPPGALNGAYSTGAGATYSFKVMANSGVNLLPGASLDVIVPAKLPANVNPQSSACNSFAVQAKPVNMGSICLSAESNKACVTVIEEKPCIKIAERSLKCVGRDQNGNWVYQLSVNVTNNTNQPANLVITPNFGSIFNLTPTSLAPGVATNVTAGFSTASNSGIVCFTIVFMAPNSEERLCDSTICLDLMPCPDPCPCPFQYLIRKTSAAQSGGNNVWISNNVSIGTPVMKIQATIVSAVVTQTCSNGSSTTYNSPAVFTATTLPAALTSGIGTGQLTWQNLNCPTISNANFGFSINLPSAPPKGCKQTIKICIQYTITDCKCQTCDTTICYEFTRKWTPFKDDWTRLITKEMKEGGKIHSDMIQAEDDEFASISMSSQTAGTITINNPAEDDFTAGMNIISMRLSTSTGVRAKTLTPKSAGWSAGTLDDNGIISTGSLAPGSELAFDVTYQNDQDFRKWDNFIEFKFLLEGVPDTLTSGLILTSRTPGSTGGDTITTDFSSTDIIEKAKTFALRFHNDNVMKDSIATVRIRVQNGNIIAVGPTFDRNTITLTGFRSITGETALLTASPESNVASISPVPTGSVIGPIFITVVADFKSKVFLDYETETSSEDVISTGTVQIFDPTTSSIGEGGGDIDINLSDAEPNPALDQTVIKFELYQDEPSVTLTITDLRGVEIAKLVKGQPLSQGKYEFTFDSSDTPSGIYLYTLSAGTSTQTRKLVIKK